MNREDIQPGDVLHVTKAASVQFVVPLLFRVIRVHDWPTYQGWVWLDGYQLSAKGDAVERRCIWVQFGGLQQVDKPSAPPAAKPQRRRATNAGPARIPRPRTTTESTPGRTR